MRVLHVRTIVVLSILYLCLVLLLYHLLWRTHALDKLFDTPGDNVPQSDNEFVQFNFKRQNGPHLPPQQVEAFGEGAQNETENATATAATESPRSSILQVLPLTAAGSLTPNQTATTRKDPGNKNFKTTVHTIANSSATMKNIDLEFGTPNYCIHVFYYTWYGNEQFDRRYLHWNHRYLPHWDKEITKKYPQGAHTPPNDIGASFYPELGCYSSKDSATMEQHMLQLRRAGVGVISVSWYPNGLADDEGTPPDPLIPALLDAAHKYAIKVTLHVEPYKGRSPMTVQRDLKYIHRKYSRHPAFYKLRVADGGTRGQERWLPLVYVYDSYLSKAQDWAEVLKPGGQHSIRGTEHDCIAIGLIVDQSHRNAILQGGFDGFYTYFASNGFSFGSSIKMWPSLVTFAKEHNLIFIPSFGPGYDDTRVRPWNQKNSKDRKDGAYYREMFTAALRNNRGGIVSVTSFNEWHEGTQIEPAIPKSSGKFTYLDYMPHPPQYYLQLTAEFGEQLQCKL